MFWKSWIGGWLHIKPDSKMICLNGGEENTTNNRMELTAAIQSIIYFKEKTI